MLEDTLEAIRCLTKAGFMINLKKSHLVEDSAKVLGHFWSTGRLLGAQHRETPRSCSQDRRRAR